MKRRQDFEGGGERFASNKRGKGGGGPDRSVTMPCVLKFLTPEIMASAVIGKGGQVIAHMRQTTQAKIGLTEHNEFYPGTECRIMTVQAMTEDSLVECSAQIIAKVAECVAAGPSELLGAPGELKLKVLMPRAAVGGIIGKGGAAIKQLQELSNAKISIGDAAGQCPSADQTVSITGTQQGLEYVMGEVNRQVQAVNKEPWFLPWASNNSIAGAAPVDDGWAGGGPSRGGPPVPVPVAPPFRGSDRRGGGHNGGGKGGPPAGPAGLNQLLEIAQSLPPYVMEDARGFALSCVVPNSLVGGLIGRSGSGTKEVQGITNTKIGIREIPGDPDNRNLNIAGPLASTCAAYMLMMKRYLDAEAQGGPPPHEPRPREVPARRR